MKRFSFTPLQILVHLTAWALVAWLTWDYFSGQPDGQPDPGSHTTPREIRADLSDTHPGQYTHQGCTGLPSDTQGTPDDGPVQLFFRGGALYLMFVGVDYHFNLRLLLADVASKKYVWVGAAAVSNPGCAGNHLYQWLEAPAGQELETPAPAGLRGGNPGRFCTMPGQRKATCSACKGISCSRSFLG